MGVSVNSWAFCLVSMKDLFLKTDLSNGSDTLRLFKWMILTKWKKVIYRTAISRTRDLHGSKPVGFSGVWRLRLSLHFCSVFCFESLESTAEFLSFVCVLWSVVKRDLKSEVCVDFRKSFSEAHFWSEFKERKYQSQVPSYSGCLEKDKWFSGTIRVDQITF